MNASDLLLLRDKDLTEEANLYAIARLLAEFPCHGFSVPLLDRILDTPKRQREPKWWALTLEHKPGAYCLGEEHPSVQPYPYGQPIAFVRHCPTTGTSFYWPEEITS